MSYAAVVRINSEAALWDALERALSHPGKGAPFQPDFSEATWAKIHIVYKGDQFLRNPLILLVSDVAAIRACSVEASAPVGTEHGRGCGQNGTVEWSA